MTDATIDRDSKSDAICKWLGECEDILRSQSEIVSACALLGIDPKALRLTAALSESDGFVEGGLFKDALDGIVRPYPGGKVCVDMQYKDSAEPDTFTPNVVTLSDATDPLGINADPMLSSRTGFMAPGPQDEE